MIAFSHNRKVEPPKLCSDHFFLGRATGSRIGFSSVVRRSFILSVYLNNQTFKQERKV